jgi:hypothetical protein
MFALLLGVAWLVLSPLCVWWIFGRGLPGYRRLIAIVILGGLEVGTIMLAASEHSSRAPRMSAEPAPAPAIRASIPSAAVARDCGTRLPVPQRVRLARGAGGVSAILVYWKAAPGECPEAAVALHRSGRRLRLWVHEGVLRARRRGTVTVPVHVDHNEASLDLRLRPPLPGRARYIAVDGRSGRAIPARTIAPSAGSPTCGSGRCAP